MFVVALCVVTALVIEDARAFQERNEHMRLPWNNRADRVH
jgi:hypothetical protein